MKKQIALALLALLLLCGCVQTAEPAPMIQPITFYYRTAKTDYAVEDGVIRAEIRDLGEGSFRDIDIFTEYFKGPASKELVSPITQDTELTDVNRSGTRLDIYLNQDTDSPAELDHSLIYACLAKTGLALEGVSKVRIYINYQEYQKNTKKRYLDYTANSLLLYDNGDTPNTIDVTLYFADESGQLLLPEKRTVPLKSDKSLETIVTNLLCGQPQSGGMQSALPAGTSMIDDEVVVNNGVCYVDFSQEFCDNAPRDEQGQILAVMSVVNTLCRLDGVNQVQIYVSGLRLEPGFDSDYKYLNLSDPWTADSSVIGPARKELGEFVCVLCLPGQFDNYLHRMTVRARAKGGVSREEAVLQALSERAAQNGLSAAFSVSPTILSVTTSQKICTVKLGADSLPEGMQGRSWEELMALWETGSLPEAERDRMFAIKSIVATLSALPEVDAVLLVEDGRSLSAEPIYPQDTWFLTSDNEE